MPITTNQNNSNSSSEPLPGARPLVLLLLDGWGIAPAGASNLLSLVKTPTFLKLIQHYPVASLNTGAKTLNARYLSLGSGNNLEDENVEPSLTLTEILARAGKKQIKITETERLAALTHFFNGHREERAAQEDWQVVSSEASRHNLSPSLALKRLLKIFLKAVAENTYDFLVLAIPTLDLVAQSGDLEAVKKIITTLDKKLKTIVSAVLNQQGTLLVSAARGNAEKMLLPGTEAVDREGTDNPVPLILIGEEFKGKNIAWPDPVNQDLSLLKPLGDLGDLAPTILEIFGLTIPPEIPGRSLFDRNRRNG